MSAVNLSQLLSEVLAPAMEAAKGLGADTTPQALVQIRATAVRADGLLEAMSDATRRSARRNQWNHRSNRRNRRSRNRRGRRMRPLNMAGAHGAWQMLATLHRPTDAEGLAAAARNLAATGLKPRDVATTLGLTEHAVTPTAAHGRGFTTIGMPPMTKNRIQTPRSTAAVHSHHADMNFKPRNSGAITRIGTITPKEPPANKPQPQGVRKSLYRNK
jgi:hypothetical protein